MEHPKNLYEEASHELNQFRERRMADRRFKPRDTPDRRVNQLPLDQIRYFVEGEQKRVIN